MSKDHSRRGSDNRSNLFIGLGRMRVYSTISLSALLLVNGVWAETGAQIDKTSIIAEASSWEQMTHGGVGDFPPELTLDGDLSPRSSWRAEGDGQFIEYNLGSIVILKGIQIAFFKGDQRQYTVEVSVSRSGEDGEWTVVVPRQQSSGESKELEEFLFTPVEVKFVRIIGHGNTNAEYGNWINIAEVGFISK